jgi:hypothetical protein
LFYNVTTILYFNKKQQQMKTHKCKIMPDNNQDTSGGMLSAAAEPRFCHSRPKPEPCTSACRVFGRQQGALPAATPDTFTGFPKLLKIK